MSGSDLLRDAVADLYACDPDDFVARRGDLAARARTAGEAVTARQIAGLRKPTRSAWVVNRLARAKPDAADRLAELGAELSSAQQALDGEAIRRLSQLRRELVDALARDAFAAAGQRSPSATLREEVITTLSAALVDPEVAELLRAGAVQRVVSRDGLGSEAGPAGGSPAAWSGTAAGSGRGASVRAGSDRAGSERTRSGRSGSPPGGGSRVVPLRPGRRAGSSSPGGAGQERSPAKVTALAAARAKAEREQAERAMAERARRRKAVAAAEQVVVRAERTERSAARTEQSQEDRVKLLESELAGARQRLAEARLQARRARTEQRQARRALDRLRDAPEGPGENG